MKPLPFHKLRGCLDRLLGCAGEFVPYLTIGLLLPGGTLIALLLWLHRRIHHRWGADGPLASRRFRSHPREHGCHDLEP
jgi:hypothetical protein